MMGYTHALSGTAAWLAAIPLVTNEALLGSHAVSLSAEQVAAGAVVCAGAALLPDIDHHDGTIANTYGPITQVLCKVVGMVSGGHRHATHSIAFAVGAGYLTDLAATHAVHVWWGVLFFVVGLGLRGVGIGFQKSDLLTGVMNALLAAAIVFMMRDVDMRYVGYAVTLGCLAHVIGDCLTPRGCPVFWPVQWSVEIPVIARTNGRAERWVMAPLLTLVITILAVRSALGDEVTGLLRS
ncbi:metal-dependent hydrolase [Actinomadura alba]|uniref:Metal-dependent hydrolase n=1 Tax=Actinomadura alba TaxID=406431 RepID=A0ABR7LKD5_9ACTN|nr:metal-dependent hydrolase [Actinomadura alba]MBC6465320.1 metal-dependent hydrolase [Actinomadura alba]